MGPEIAHSHAVPHVVAAAAEVVVVDAAEILPAAPTLNQLSIRKWHLITKNPIL